MDRISGRLMLASFVALGLVAFAGYGSARAAEILRENFAGARLDPAWAVDAAQGNTVSVKGGCLEILARENTFAHIERPLAKDYVRIAASLQPAPAVSWTASVFAYWGPGDWCQMGVIRDGSGGRFYVTEMVEGGATEHNGLSRCDPDSWPRVAIEIGADCVRYLASSGGQPFQAEAVSPRPESFLGPPALLIAGKGYGRGDSAYPAPDLDNNYGDPGNPGRSRVRDLVVEETAAGRLKMTPAEIRAFEERFRDAAGEEELAGDGDPTFDSVARHFPVLKFPCEALGVKDHPHEFLVAADGAIEFGESAAGWAGGRKTAFFEVGSPPARLGTGALVCTKRLLEAGFPVVVAECETGGLHLEQTAFGWSKRMSPDEELCAYLRLTLRGGDGVTSAGQEIAFRVLPEAHGAAAPVLRWSRTVPDSGSASVFVRLCSTGAEPRAVEIEGAEFAERLAEVLAYWRALLGSGMQVTVPEERVNNAWQAWLAYNFLDVDKKDGRFEPHDGAGFYEAVFDYSAALYCHALDLWGFHAAAEEYLASLVGMVKPGGPFFVNYGLPGTGALLTALAEHYRLTGDAAWLRRVAPNMLGLADWILAERKKSMTAREGGRPVTYGLIKFTPYADHQEQTFDYYGDCYCCAGLEAAVAAFEEAGVNGGVESQAASAVVVREADLMAAASRLAAEAAVYRADILASMDKAVLERRGMKILPMEPDTHRLLKSTGYRSGGYYGLVASMMLESGFLPADDPRAETVARFLEQRGGLILGMCEFAGGVDHAYTYGYWLHSLRRDDVRPVILGFFGSLAYGMSPATSCGVEVTQLKTGDNTPTTPHLYSGTQQLRLLRMMLLREEGGRLLIGHAIPRHWLAAGQSVKVTGAPTRFGPLSFNIGCGEDRVEVSIDVPSRRRPASIELRLRLPGGAAIRSVDLEGDADLDFTSDTITLRKAEGNVRLAVGL